MLNSAALKLKSTESIMSLPLSSSLWRSFLGWRSLLRFLFSVFLHLQCKCASNLNLATEIYNNTLTHAQLYLFCFRCCCCCLFLLIIKLLHKVHIKRRALLAAIVFYLLCALHVNDFLYLFNSTSSSVTQSVCSALSAAIQSKIFLSF